MDGMPPTILPLPFRGLNVAFDDNACELYQKRTLSLVPTSIATPGFSCAPSTMVRLVLEVLGLLIDGVVPVQPTP